LTENAPGIENTGRFFVARSHRQHHFVSALPVQKLHRRCDRGAPSRRPCRKGRRNGVRGGPSHHTGSESGRPPTSRPGQCPGFWCSLSTVFDSLHCPPSSTNGISLMTPASVFLLSGCAEIHLAGQVWDHLHADQSSFPTDSDTCECVPRRDFVRGRRLIRPVDYFRCAVKSAMSGVLSRYTIRS
jgi:hypothetical protein